MTIVDEIPVDGILKMTANRLKQTTVEDDGDDEDDDDDDGVSAAVIVCSLFGNLF